ncbi:hypothetical protein [Clostridium sp.]|uniref:hypothetical protein n=1 Tax=Clostridium sp. TaxID=1506 RepID=UPI002840AAAB|nr:hypothetical protein [Clostridium sp.]MDR3596096.1 hypothetical protein [Clostridium sp.]
MVFIPKILLYHDNGIYNCKCARKYSDIHASWGWDSDLNTWFYGHTLSTYDPVTKSDIPLLFRYMQAKHHDSISGIVSLVGLREVSPKLPISNICFDSANDN